MSKCHIHCAKMNFASKFFTILIGVVLQVIEYYLAVYYSATNFVFNLKVIYGIGPQVHNDLRTVPSLAVTGLYLWMPWSMLL